jgi:hypothetical protein
MGFTEAQRDDPNKQNQFNNNQDDYEIQEIDNQPTNTMIREAHI